MWEICCNFAVIGASVAATYIFIADGVVAKEITERDDNAFITEVPDPFTIQFHPCIGS